jgi:hypothetical protein
MTPEVLKGTDFRRAVFVKPVNNASRKMPMTKPLSPEEKASHKFLAAIKKIRRNTSGDPMYHSGRKKKEYASPYLEFLDKLEKAARKMPQIYEFDIGHADGTRYVDWAEGERVLNEIIYECQQSLKAIEHAKIDQEARSWARGQGVGG